MKRTAWTVLIVLSMLLTLVSCGDGEKAPTGGAGDANVGAARESKWKDGVYTEKSEKEKNGGYVIVTLTIENGAIKLCTMEMYDRENNPKDEKYGSGGPDQVYKIAQAAIESAAQYPELLVQAGSIEDVDAISGATETYDVFRDVVQKLLEQAERK